jgi:hypothetical protein
MVISYFVIELRVFLAVRVAQSTRAARNEDFIRAEFVAHRKWHFEVVQLILPIKIRIAPE